MKKISVFIFSTLCLFAVSLQLAGQEADTSKVYGLRLGVDIARVAYFFNDPSELGLEFSADFEVYPNFYACFEGGYNQTEIQNDYYTYGLSGKYFRIGVDHNFLKTDVKPDYNSIYGGLRYGYSQFDHSFTNADIPSAVYGESSFSGEYLLNAHWIGLTGGIKVQVLKNFYLGWSIQYNFLLSKYDGQPDPILIPGYGHVDENKSFTVHYSLFYTIPFFKK